MAVVSQLRSLHVLVQCYQCWWLYGHPSVVWGYSSSKGFGRASRHFGILSLDVLEASDGPGCEMGLLPRHRFVM